MGYLDHIQKDLTDAMKAKDELRLSPLLRMVKSALKNKEIEKIRPLDDAESLQVLQTLIKQRKESAEQFARAVAPISPTKKFARSLISRHTSRLHPMKLN